MTERPDPWLGLADRYDRGRAIDGVDDWRAAMSAYLPPQSGKLVLDVGSGTGWWGTRIERWFGSRVVGIEPSTAMLRAAGAAGVRQIGARAEQIPLGDGTCGAAWISTVIHHIADLPAAARELRRVLVEGGPVLIRSAFPGRTDGITLFRYFPEAGAVVDTYPSVDLTTAAFRVSGFEVVEMRPVPQVTATDPTALLERALERTDSTLARIDDDAYRQGVERLTRAVGELAGPVIDWLDLLVLA